MIKGLRIFFRLRKRKLYKKAQKELESEQDKYDKDTEHGLNSAKQALWSESIQEQIKEMRVPFLSTLSLCKDNN